MGRRGRPIRKAALGLFLIAGMSAGAAARAERPVAATVTVVPADTGACTARWNGEGVTNALLLDRAVKAVEAIQRVGGVQDPTAETLPLVLVKAPAETSFACAEPSLYGLKHAGFTGVLLLPLGEARGRSAVEFSWPDTGPETVTYMVTMGPGDRLAWDDTRTDLAGLAVHARAAAAGREVGMAPGNVLIMPSPASTFGEIYEIVRALRDAGLVPSLAPVMMMP